LKDLQQVPNIIVWDTDFVKICNLLKILNNKDCDLRTKPSNFSKFCNFFLSLNRLVT
jgi:hypothetical protein